MTTHARAWWAAFIDNAESRAARLNRRPVIEVNEAVTSYFDAAALGLSRQGTPSDMVRHFLYRELEAVNEELAERGYYLITRDYVDVAANVARIVAKVEANAVRIVAKGEARA